MGKTLYSRTEMQRINIETLKKRGVTPQDIALISYNQQRRYNPDISMKDCYESVYKILSLRDVFHILQLGCEIDRLTELKMFEGPIQEILMQDLGVFGVDEVLGLNVAGLYGVIGETNFGDIDVNKPGIIAKLNDEGKGGKTCHTFLDDIVGAIAAAASTRAAQVFTENQAQLDTIEDNNISIFDIEDIV